jgi:hypothetical protein
MECAQRFARSTQRRQIEPLSDEQLPQLDEMVKVNAKGPITPTEAYAIHRERLAAHGAEYDPIVRKFHARRTADWPSNRRTIPARGHAAGRNLEAVEAKASCQRAGRTNSGKLTVNLSVFERFNKFCRPSRRVNSMTSI